MTSAPDTAGIAVRTPVGSIVVLAACALMYAAVAIQAVENSPDAVLVTIWSLQAALFGLAAGLLAARRRAALPVVWTAIATVIAPRVMMALGPFGVTGQPAPGLVELFALGLLIVVGLRISRPSMRATLR